MVSVLTNFLSIFSNGLFSLNETAPVVASSGVYRAYTNMPGYITKCTGPRYNNERELFDLFLTEAYNKHGVCMTYYITTFDTNADKIWGEDNNRRFVRKFDFMANFTLPREEKLWNKFGIAGMDQFSMYSAKRHFKTASTFDYAQTSADVFPPYIPQIGDILMSDYAKYVYEIVEVKEEIGMYLLSKQHVWEFIVKPFKNENIGMSSDVSATMPEMARFVNSPDIMNIKPEITAQKPNIIYQPKSCEKPNANPFGQW